MRVPAAIAASFAILFLSAGCSAQSASDAKPGPAAYVAAPGERFDIRLEANPSTGYQWEIGTPLDDKIVRLVGSDFQRGPTASPSASAADGAAPLVGQGGIETWRFEAVAHGRTTIELIYRRPWEKDVAPARRAVYAVEVR